MSSDVDVQEEEYVSSVQNSRLSIHIPRVRALDDLMQPEIPQKGS
jgi:hypothetical protein